MTKEELLQKGISEEVADEIVAAFTDSNENSLQALTKALDDEPMGDLFKAKGGKDEEDEDEEDEEYDEKFMKKMKRYMKENEKEEDEGEGEKEPDDKDDKPGLFGKEKAMKKAIENIDTDSTSGAIVEMTDLAPFLAGQADFNSTLAKAVCDLSRKIDKIVSQNAKSYDLMQKAARVTEEQAKLTDTYLSTPTGRKGVTASVSMQKANAAVGNSGLVYETLMKATRGGDKTAGEIISEFESVGKNINRLTPVQKDYINTLLTAEAK